MNQVKAKKHLSQHFLEENGERLRAKTRGKFGDHVVSFRTELQFISDHKAV